MQRAKWLVPSVVLLAVAVAGCGGTKHVKASSLEPRLLPSSAVPGFSLERKLDWSDPINLVAEGIQVPQAIHPSDAVARFNSAHLEGSAGEILKQGGGLDATEVHVGVAKFKSSADAASVRDWMHGLDLQQPCFSECAFSPRASTLAGVPGSRYVIQTATSLPGPPPGVKLPPNAPKLPANTPRPANYLAEFSIGPYLYWVSVSTNTSAKSRFEAGVKAYYQHVKQQPT
jgi:hypothetical protein